MTSPNPTLAEVLDQFITGHLAGVHVSMPGIVQSYDKAAQTVDVQPAVKNVYYDADDEEQVESLPLLSGVPVSFPRANDFFVSFPIKKGDSVLLVFGERSMDKWQDSGEESDPVDLRRHSLSDAVAIPGVYPSKKALKDAHGENMVLGKDGGGQIHLKPNDEVHIGQENAPDFVAMAQKVLTELTNMQTVFNNHGHVTTATIGPSAVVGLVSAPTPQATGIPPTSATMPAPGSVAADKTKAT